MRSSNLRLKSLLTWRPGGRRRRPGQRSLIGDRADRGRVGRRCNGSGWFAIIAGASLVHALIVRERGGVGGPDAEMTWSGLHCGLVLIWDHAGCHMAAETDRREPAIGLVSSSPSLSIYCVCEVCVCGGGGGGATGQDPLLCHIY